MVARGLAGSRQLGKHDAICIIGLVRKEQQGRKISCPLEAAQAAQRSGWQQAGCLPSCPPAVATSGDAVFRSWRLGAGPGQPRSQTAARPANRTASRPTGQQAKQANKVCAVCGLCLWQSNPVGSTGHKAPMRWSPPSTATVSPCWSWVFS